MRPVGVLKKPKKKERQRKKLNSGKLDIRRDHPRRRIETPFGVVGGPRAIKFQLSSKSVHWFPSCGGWQIAHSHCIGQWLIQQLVLPYKP